MGACYSYVAVKVAGRDDNRKRLLDAFALRPPTSVETTAGTDGPIGMLSPSGFYLIVDRSSVIAQDAEALEILSRDTDVIVGQADDRINYCSVAVWSRGQILWSVSHDLECGPKHLQVLGEPAKPFAAIKKKIENERANTPRGKRWDHYFEIPVALFESLVGYRYDRANELFDENGADTLIPAVRKRPGGAAVTKAEGIARVKGFMHEVDKAIASTIELSRNGIVDYEHKYEEKEGPEFLIEGSVRLESSEMRYRLKSNRISVWYFDGLPGVEFPLSEGRHYHYKVRKGRWEPEPYSLSGIVGERLAALGRLNEHYKLEAAGGFYTFTVSVHRLGEEEG
ncbi:MAG: hypothetical protein JSS83_21415 [Cyanobacteria bacterium SZAS LIN-3]|nr:hypothetical protein [Cyanobacteria bacterium SZAS LIN-3]